VRVLITGGRGWIGSAVCMELQRRGHKVEAYDIKDGWDIHDSGDLEPAMAEADAVAHLAAIPHPNPARRWEDYWGLNVVGTQEVARGAAEAGVQRLVYASSTAYYGAQRGWLHGPFPLVEIGPNAVQRNMWAKPPELSDYNAAAWAYACSKVAAETVLAAYGMVARLDVVILRFAPIPTSGEPWEWGLLCDRERAAQAIADAIEAPAGRYHVYNVANKDVALVDTSLWDGHGTKGG